MGTGAAAGWVRRSRAPRVARPNRLRSFDPVRLADLEYRPRSTGRGPWTCRTSGSEQGRRPGSPLLAEEHAALVRAYAALLAAVHH